jgi:hypothetical protein
MGHRRRQWRRAAVKTRSTAPGIPIGDELLQKIGRDDGRDRAANRARRHRIRGLRLGLAVCLAHSILPPAGDPPWRIKPGRYVAFLRVARHRQAEADFVRNNPVMTGLARSTLDRLPDDPDL